MLLTPVHEPLSSPLLLLTTNKKTFCTQMRYLLGSSFGAIAQKKLSEKKTNHEFDTVASNQKAKKIHSTTIYSTLWIHFIFYFMLAKHQFHFEFLDTYQLIEIKIFISLSSVLDYYIVKPNTFKSYYPKIGILLNFFNK